MALTTVYDVQLNYTINDRAASGLTGISNAADRANKSTGGLLDSLKGIAATLGVGLLFQKSKEYFIDFNSRMEQTKNSIAVMNMQLNQGMKWDEASQKAGQYFADLKDFASKNIGTFQEYIDAYQKIGGVVGGFGFTGQSGVDITKKFVTATSALGIGDTLKEKIGMGAQDIRGLTQGAVTGKDIFAQQLLRGININDYKEWNALVKKTPQEAQKLFEKMFDSPAIKAGIAANADTFEAKFSTLSSNVESLLGKAGEGLFTALKPEMDSFNNWVENNSQQIADFARKFGDSLVEGFKTLKSIAQFIIEHKDVLLGIAKAWLATKAVGSLVGSVSGGLAGAGANMGVISAALTRLSAKGGISVLADVVPEVAKNFMAMVNPMTLVVAGLAAFAVGLNMVAEAFETQQRGRITSSAEFGSIRDVALARTVSNAAVARGTLFNRAKELGLISGEGTFKEKEARQVFERMAAGTEDSQASLKDVPRMVNAFNALFTSMGADEVLRRMGGGSSKDANKPGVVKKDKDINVTIHRIEVPAADPDRFVFGLVKKFNDIVRNPVSADGAIRGT